MTKDECIRLDLAHLKQLGMLKRHCLNRRVVSWSCRGRRTAELTVVADVHCNEPYPCLKFTGYANGQSVDCMVWLDCVPMPFGGERWYALCPMTVRKCTTLVLPPGQSRFASVKGWGVSYGSQRECPIHRGHRAIGKAEARLKALSKYTRKPTRERLLDRLIERQVFVEEEIDKLAQMVF